MRAHPINRRMAGSPTRMEAYDRRLAAIHEAGHALIAIHLGYKAHAWIHRNETADPLREKTWLGHMTVHNLPTEPGHPHVRMVAVAGMVGETLWKCGHDEEYAEPWGWEDYLLDEASMSPSDWRLSGCVPGEPDDDLFHVVAQVGALFMGESWPKLNTMSRRLMCDTKPLHSFSYGQPALVGTGA